MKSNKILLIAGGVGMLHTIVTMANRYSGIIYIRNNSAKTIWYKPESGSIAQPILPNSSITDKADGVATGKNKVYKFSDGICVTVNADGSVSPKFINAFIWEIPIHFINSKWLSVPPDAGWNDLFTKSLTI